MAIVKKLKQHPPLPPSRYEVGIYCRVSTASKTQVVSAGHQLSGLIADVANASRRGCMTSIWTFSPAGHLITVRI